MGIIQHYHIPGEGLSQQVLLTPLYKYIMYIYPNTTIHYNLLQTKKYSRRQMYCSSNSNKVSHSKITRTSGAKYGKSVNRFCIEKKTIIKIADPQFAVHCLGLK